MEKRFTKFSFGTMKLSKLDNKLHYNVKIECDKETTNKIAERFKGSRVLYKETERGINFKVLPSDYDCILRVCDEFNAIYEVSVKDSDVLVLSSDKNVEHMLGQNWSISRKGGVIIGGVMTGDVLKIAFVDSSFANLNFKKIKEQLESYFENKEALQNFKVTSVGRYIVVIGSDNILSAVEECFTHTVKLRELIMIPFGINSQDHVDNVEFRIKNYFGWK